jgi:hypothetical protein
MDPDRDNDRGYARKAPAVLVLVEAHTSKRLNRLAATHDLQHDA